MTQVNDGNEGLVAINQGILNHIRHVSSNNTRFVAAAKLGISQKQVDEICSLDSFQVQEKAREYASKGALITVNNLDNRTNNSQRSHSIDSFFKASIN